MAAPHELNLLKSAAAFRSFISDATLLTDKPPIAELLAVGLSEF